MGASFLGVPFWLEGKARHRGRAHRRPPKLVTTAFIPLLWASSPSTRCSLWALAPLTGIT